MGFFVLAKHGLKGKIKISYILVSKRERTRREGEKRRRKEEEEKKRKKEDSSQDQAKVWNLGFLYGTTWAFKALNGFPCNCIVISCLQT